MIAHPRRSTRKVATASLPTHDHEKDYAAFLMGVRETFAAHATSPLFTTDAADLFDLYLDALPADRQIHTCTACRRFVKEYGALVTITDDGQTIPIMWDRCPDFYRLSVLTLSKAVRRAKVTGPWFSKEPIWGIPHTGSWSHLAVDARNVATFRDRLRTPKQVMAAKREDYRTVTMALTDFTPPMLSEALRLFETDSLHRSERFRAPLKWLFDLHTQRAKAKGKARDNILWLAIATAPDGFCHPRASVIGSLLEDIAAGKRFEDVRASFNAKVGGLVYQRPQVAPAAGNIAAAEKIIEHLGIALSLERRFARLDELVTIWKPSPVFEARSGGGVFRHLAPKEFTSVPSLDIPSITMTWAKFIGILPTSEQIDLLVPYGNANFSAFLTAASQTAPPILRWDHEESRNPVSQYVYHGGSPASSWRLHAGAWCVVTGIAKRANMWGDKPSPHLGDGVTMILQGAVDTRTGQGNALFPEILRDDLHQVRSTIEAYSKRAEITGTEDASACGLAFGTKDIGAVVRVLSSGRWTNYKIDRWD